MDTRSEGRVPSSRRGVSRGPKGGCGWLTSDVFVRDLATGFTQRVTVHPNGKQITGAPSDDATISANGQTVAFDSPASGLVVGDTNGVLDVFVRDR